MGHERRRANRCVIVATAGLACLSLLVSGCGGSAGSSAQPGTATTAGPLAFSLCMRRHGVPNFPDPDGQGTFPPLTQEALGASKRTSLVAQSACGHLLSRGSGTARPQQRRQKLAFALKVARCLRAHG